MLDHPSTHTALAAMDIDETLERAERDASPDRFPAPYSNRRPSHPPPSAGHDAAPPGAAEKTSPIAPDMKVERPGDAAAAAAAAAALEDGARVAHSSSSSTSGTTTSLHAAATVPATRQATGVSRMRTGRDLERHPTEMSRIATHRSQHQNTVGRSLRSRQSTRPLPAFGAGKPYPPPLPAAEEYVVEFDGPDDPLHPLNWPMKRK